MRRVIPDPSQSMVESPRKVRAVELELTEPPVPMMDCEKSNPMRFLVSSGKLDREMLQAAFEWKEGSVVFREPLRHSEVEISTIDGRQYVRVVVEPCRAGLHSAIRGRLEAYIDSVDSELSRSTPSTPLLETLITRIRDCVTCLKQEKLEGSLSFEVVDGSQEQGGPKVGGFAIDPSEPPPIEPISMTVTFPVSTIPTAV